MKKLRHNHTREKKSKIPHLKTGGQIFSFNLSRTLLIITILQKLARQVLQGKKSVYFFKFQ